MLQFVVNGLCKGGIYAVTALGFGLIYSTTRVLHIAHAGVFAGAAYGLYVGLALLKLPLIAALALSAIVAVVCGLVIEQLVYWPLARRSAPTTVLLISSLGVQIVIVNLITLFFGNTTQVVQKEAEVIFQFGTLHVARIQIAQLVVALLSTLTLAIILWKTHLGQSIRSLADDPELATVMGVPVRRTRLAVLGLGSLFAATGACLMGLDVGADPYSGFPIMLTAAVACIIGGLHHLLAPALGAFLLGLTQSLVVWTISGRWEESVTFGILVLFLLFRPQGLLGVVKRVDE